MLAVIKKNSHICTQNYEFLNEDEISKEIKEIHHAIVGGITTYTLKYNVKTKKRLTGIKIVEE